MAYFRVQSDFVYRVITAGLSWYYTIVVDQTGTVGYRDINSPQGPVRDPNTIIPEDVNDAIQESIAQVRSVMAATSALSGQLDFSGDTSKEVVFDTPMSDTRYRVHLDAPDFVTTRVKYKATTGFIVDVGSTYTGTIGFDVFVG